MTASHSLAESAALNLERKHGIHQGRAAIDVERLPGDETGVVPAEQPDRIADVGGCADPPKRGPAAFVPRLDRLENFGGQAADDAIVAGAGADDVDGDAAL